MRLQYKTYEEAKEDFTWSERWEVFSESQENLNIAYECVDRHPKSVQQRSQKPLLCHRE